MKRPNNTSIMRQTTKRNAADGFQIHCHLHQIYYIYTNEREYECVKQACGQSDPGFASATSVKVAIKSFIACKNDSFQEEIVNI